MSRESTLIAGAWRAGLDVNTASIVEQFEAKLKSGFHLFPQEQAVIELAELLDGYDEYTEFVDEPVIIQYEKPFGPEPAPLAPLKAKAK